MDPTTLSIVGGGEDPALEARRAWRSAAAVARARGNDLARDAVVATVFVVGSRADPDASAASRAADDALEAVARSDRWVAELDAPGGPRSAEAGVRVPAPVDEKEEKSDEECDGGDPSSGGERNAWTPLVTRVRVPRLPKDAAVEVQFVLLDGAGPGAAPAKTSASYVDDRADDSDEDDDGGDHASARRRVVSFDAERVGARFVENRWCFARAAVARGDVTAAAVAGAVEALGGALRAAGLGWEHAGTFRGYYAVPERSDGSGEEKDFYEKLAGWIRSAANPRRRARWRPRWRSGSGGRATRGWCWSSPRRRARGATDAGERRRVDVDVDVDVE